MKISLVRANFGKNFAEETSSLHMYCNESNMMPEMCSFTPNNMSECKAIAGVICEGI